MDKSTETKINRFIDKLAQVEVGNNVYNQYSYTEPENAIRRHNLKLYLSEIYHLNPQYLLLSEAPGYKGMRLTGVPFTSEIKLLEGITPWGIFGSEKGYSKTSEFQQPQKEQSATIVWDTFVSLNQVLLSWPSFPFHPHKAESQWSNRKPTPEEVQIGQEFFTELAEIFGIKKFIAVGRVAQKILLNKNISYDYVRHPANGGKNKFQEGLFGTIRNK